MSTQPYTESFGLIERLSTALDLDLAHLNKLALVPPRDLADAREALMYAIEASEPVPVCLNCGSQRVTSIEGDIATGVTAPDGGAETRYEQGLKCLDCGAIE